MEEFSYQLAGLRLWSLTTFRATTFMIAAAMYLHRRGSLSQWC